MPKKIKFESTPGRSIKPVSKQKVEHVDCNWCKYGTIPDELGLCSSCVREFKSLLCCTRWQKLRLALLSVQPYCILCIRSGIYHPAEVIDHILDWRYRPDLFWVESNLRPLAKSCHDSLTQTQYRNGFVFKR